MFYVPLNIWRKNFFLNGLSLSFNLKSSIQVISLYELRGRYVGLYTYMHKWYVWRSPCPCVHMWRLTSGYLPPSLSTFLVFWNSLLTKLAFLPFWLSWLASESLGSPCLNSHCWGSRAFSNNQCVLGIQTRAHVVCSTLHTEQTFQFVNNVKSETYSFANRIISMKKFLALL